MSDDEESGERLRRMIPENLGSSDYLAENAPIVGKLEYNDAFIAFGPALLTFFVSMNVLPESLGIVGFTASGLVGFVGLLAILSKPKYMTLNRWLNVFREFRSRTTQYKKHLVTDGGRRIDSFELTPSNDTRRITGIYKGYPKFDALERTDDTFFAVIQFTGANLDTVDIDEYNRYVNQLASSFNTQLEDPIQLYLPKRAYDPTHHIERLDDRLTDDDVVGNPILSRYINDRATWISTVSENVYIRKYYAIVSVSKYDIVSEAAIGGGNKALSSLPGGDALRDLFVGLLGESTQRDLSESDIKERQLEELDRRVRAVRDALTQGPQNTSRRLSANEAGVVLKEFWEGESLTGDEANSFMRQTPYVTRSE